MELGLHAFALPTVITAIKKVGPPTAIFLVPRKTQFGPLLVTLATELACVLVSVLHEQLVYGGPIAVLEDATAQESDEAYVRAQEKFKALRAQERQTLEQARAVERLILVRSAGEILEQANGANVSRSPDGGYLHWFLHDVCTAERKTFYDSCWERYQLLQRQIKEMEAQILKLRKKVAPPAAGPAQWSIDLSAPYDALHGGAASILLQTDRQWWESWAAEIKKEVSRTFSNRGAVAMLRDVHLNRLAAIEELFRTSNYDAIWAYLLEKPNCLPHKCASFIERYQLRHRAFLDECFPSLAGNADEQMLLLGKTLRRNDDTSKKIQQRIKALHKELSEQIGSALLKGSPSINLKWPAHVVHKGKSAGNPLSTEAVQDFRKLLATQDSMVRDWLELHSGSHHPCNWVKSKSRRPRRIAGAESYPSERAINELYFCLSRGRVPFKPVFSICFSKEKWTAWMRVADQGSAPYWERPESQKR